MSVAEDLHFEWSYRVDTLAEHTLEMLDVDVEQSAHAEGYGPTRKRHFRKLVEGLPLPRNGAFLDLGCGKGKLLLLATRYGFTRSIGVEFSEQLCATARDNLVRFEKRAGPQPTVEIHCQDAARYEFRGDESVVYMCDPFHGPLLKRVLDNLNRSIESVPRDLWLLYCNPTAKSDIEAHSPFRLVREFRYGGAVVNAYRAGVGSAHQLGGY